MKRNKISAENRGRTLRRFCLQYLQWGMVVAGRFHLPFEFNKPTDKQLLRHRQRAGWIQGSHIPFVVCLTGKGGSSG